MADKSILLIERIFPSIVGTLIVASGKFTFFDPDAMGETLGIAPLNASGDTEIGATYGGLVVGCEILEFAGFLNRIIAVAALAEPFFGAGGLMSKRTVIQAIDRLGTW